MVDPGWVSDGAFLSGYGAAQAVPGPLVTFAAYLGAVSTLPPNGMAGGLLTLVAIFLPAFLLVWGVLPWWDRLRGIEGFRRGLAGTNARGAQKPRSALGQPPDRPMLPLFYLEERPLRGLSLAVPAGNRTPRRTAGMPVERRDVLGGMIHEYRRAA